MKYEVNATLYLANSSACLNVVLTYFSDRRFELIDEQGDTYYHGDITEAKVAPKLGTLPREVTLHGLGLLSIANNNNENYPIFEDWLDEGTSNASLAKLERKPTLILAACVSVPVLLFIIVKFVIPAMAVHFSSIVPDSAIRVASQQTLYALDKAVLSPTQLPEEKRQQLSLAWNDVIQKIDLSHASFDVQFRDGGSMGANAFALPDGTVVFTDQLLELLEYDINLSTAILLHELGHVENRHSMRLISETIATAVAIDYFFGDLGAVIEFIGGIGATVAQNQFSQKLEWEADNFALAQASALNMNPAYFAQAMEKLATTSSQASVLDKYLQSHPVMSERIENAKKHAAPSNPDDPEQENKDH